MPATNWFAGMARSYKFLRRIFFRFPVIPVMIPSLSRGGLGWGWVGLRGITHPHPSLPLEGEGVVSIGKWNYSVSSSVEPCCSVHGMPPCMSVAVFPYMILAVFMKN